MPVKAASHRLLVNRRVAGARAVSGAYLRIARLAPAGGRPLVAALVVLNLAMGLLPILFILGTSAMIGRVPAAVAGGVGSEEWRELVASFVLAASAFLVEQLLAPIRVSLGELLARRIDGRIYRRLIRASLSSDGIGPLEDQGLLDELSQAVTTLEQSVRTPGLACAGLLALIARYTQLVAAAAIVAAVFSWPAALALLAVTMGFRTAQRGGHRKASRFFASDVGRRREARYLRATAVQAAAAKEIRVFGLAGWLTARYHDVQMVTYGLLWAERRRIFLYPYVVATAFGLVAGGVVLGAIGGASSSGAIGLAQLALAVQASLVAIRLGEFFPESDLQTQYGMVAYDGVQAFERGVAKVSDGTVRLEPRLDPRGLPQSEIRFESVDFRYPGSERAVLDRLNLTIPAGCCTAIVGLNGAGKTTIIKLLARLYEPTAGRLVVDGRDVRSFDMADWRRQIGVIFQDFNRYELSAAENIGFGAIEMAADREKIRAAAKRAGVLAALDRLPNGLDTPLARQYAGGAELSGGQWQRVAIARALFALESGASILVLDEPTAALDVRAEAAFFDKFLDLTRGATSLLISHRFSSVRHADRIVVLAGGRIVEQGTHESLLAADGRYAGLFRLQAERFADDGDGLDAAEANDILGGTLPLARMRPPEESPAGDLR
jgi:ATP-binding cassette subfamily B protein